MNDRGPEERGYIYVASSDALQELADERDHLFLLKIGFCSDLAARLAGLNGDIDGCACLGYRDWIYRHHWRFDTALAAERSEKMVQAFLRRRFSSFDQERFRRGRKVRSNGCSEVHRISEHDLPVLAELPRLPHANTRLDAATLHRVVSVVVLTIKRELPSFHAEWARDEVERPDDPDLDEPEDDDPGRERDEISELLISEHHDRLDAFGRNAEDGWPYED